jgi:F-type H+-transporting ATPase subunit b
MLLTIDGTFFVQILNFILFWVLLNHFFIAPTQRAIEERQRIIANLYREGDEFASQTAAALAEAGAILGEARRRTDESMRAASGQASDEAHLIERKASEEVAASIALAHATVAAERKQALEKQEAFVTDLARSMVERATGFEEVA